MKQRNRHSKNNRHGAAATELALMLPLIAVILLGSIDAGQTIYVGQIINEASREGARQASRVGTVHENQVARAAFGYIQNSFPSLSNSSLTVSVADSEGNAIPGGDLTSVTAGSPVAVTVDLQYESVRWLKGLPTFNGQTISTTTQMRRE